MRTNTARGRRQYHDTRWHCEKLVRLNAHANDMEQIEADGAMTTLGATIRRLRQARKVTLRKFAGMVGETPSNLSKIERDKFRPSDEQIKVIADVFGQQHERLLVLPSVEDGG